MEATENLFIPEMPERISAFVPVEDSHRQKYRVFARTAIVHIFLGRGGARFPAPMVSEAMKKLHNSFEWDPVPLGGNVFLIEFPSRSSLLKAHRLGRSKHYFIFTVRPWSFRDWARIRELQIKVRFDLFGVPPRCWNVESVRRFTAGFCLPERVSPNTRVGRDLSAFEIAAVCEKLGDIPCLNHGEAKQ